MLGSKSRICKTLFVIISVICLAGAIQEPSAQENSETGAQKWSEKDLVRLRKGFERIRWTFNEFIRRLYEKKSSNNVLVDDTPEQDDDFQQIRRQLVSLETQLRQSPLNEQQKEELNRSLFSLVNLFQELGDLLRTSSPRRTPRQLEQPESAAEAATTTNEVPQDDPVPVAGIPEMPDIPSSVLGVIGETTNQMKAMNDRMAQISSQMSQIMQTGARILTGQLRSNGTGVSPWSYGEPAFKGITATMEMLQNLQKELSSLNNQWRDLAWKLVPSVLAGQGSLGQQ